MGCDFQKVALYLTLPIDLRVLPLHCWVLNYDIKINKHEERDWAPLRTVFTGYMELATWNPVRFHLPELRKMTAINFTGCRNTTSCCKSRRKKRRQYWHSLAGSVTHITLQFYAHSFEYGSAPCPTFTVVD